MKFIEKYLLKKKIKKMKNKLYLIIFNEVFNPRTDINGLEIDFHGTVDIIDFNSKKIITEEWLFGTTLGDIKSFNNEYNSKEKLTNKTYIEVKKLDRLRKYLSLL